MRYTVVWLEEAEEDFVALWASATDSAEIASAGTELHRLLTDDPADQGESRDEGQRMLFLPPLGVRFEVRSEDLLVTVLAVWSFRRRTP